MQKAWTKPPPFDSYDISDFVGFLKKWLLKEAVIQIIRRIHAHSVRSSLHQKMNLPYTWEHIQEKSLTLAHDVQSSLHQAVNLPDT